MAALVAGLLVAAAAWWFVAGSSGAPCPRPASRAVSAIAVLPFQDPASNPDSSYLAAGMTEGLIADLAQIGSLKVISRLLGIHGPGHGAVAGRRSRASSGSTPS